MIKTMKTLLGGLGASAAVFSICGTVYAATAPVVVTETTSGSAANWLYDFTFSNVATGQSLYFFGIEDATGKPLTQPAAFTAYTGNYPVGSQSYNLYWVYKGDFSNAILTGQSVSGFVVSDTASAAQASFQFFGYTYYNGATYSGGQNDGGFPTVNPGFVGTTGTGAVPEPATWALMLVGMGAIGSAMRRRQSISVTYA